MDNLSRREKISLLEMRIKRYFYKDWLDCHQLKRVNVLVKEWKELTGWTEE